eukprot:m.305086 g.305086  ORF g.305086 m.305086 type:complete len:300 (+) comp17496_c0_seq1:2399-3298(+)
MAPLSFRARSSTMPPGRVLRAFQSLALFSRHCCTTRKIACSMLLREARPCVRQSSACTSRHYLVVVVVPGEWLCLAMQRASRPLRNKRLCPALIFLMECSTLPFTASCRLRFALLPRACKMPFRMSFAPQSAPPRPRCSCIQTYLPLIISSADAQSVLHSLVRQCARWSQMQSLESRHLWQGRIPWLVVPLLVPMTTLMGERLTTLSSLSSHIRLLCLAQALHGSVEKCCPSAPSIPYLHSLWSACSSLLLGEFFAPLLLSTYYPPRPGDVGAARSFTPEIVSLERISPSPFFIGTFKS